MYYYGDITVCKNFLRSDSRHSLMVICNAMIPDCNGLQSKQSFNIKSLFHT